MKDLILSLVKSSNAVFALLLTVSLTIGHLRLEVDWNHLEPDLRNRNGNTRLVVVFNHPEAKLPQKIDQISSIYLTG